MRIKKIAVVCSLLGAAALGHAEGFYVLGSVGQSNFRDDSSTSGLQADAAARGVSLDSLKVDKRDTGYKLQVGYQINNHFAIEGGYVDLGQLKADISATGVNAVDARAKWKASGWNVAGLLTLPVNAGFSLFFKGGIIQAKVKMTETLDISQGASSTTVTVSDSTTKIKANAGIGVSYNFIDSLSARIEAERFAKLGNGDVGEEDVDLFSLGLSYKF